VNPARLERVGDILRGKLTVMRGQGLLQIQYRTPTQLGLLERFHHTPKEEEVYWRLYDDPTHARQCPDEFRTHELRPHWGLIPEDGADPRVPSEVYPGEYSIQTPKWQEWAKHA
jgi:hypothetical protein